MHQQYKNVHFVNSILYTLCFKTFSHGQAYMIYIYSGGT